MAKKKKSSSKAPPKKSVASKVIVEADVIDSLEGYKTKKAEERKLHKLLFTNKLAGWFIVGYAVLLLIVIFLPLLNNCELPYALTLVEKVGTTFVALILGFYFGSKES